jgi:hypothetical protein
MPIKDFIINTYCLLENFVKQFGKSGKRGASPKISDAEVITIELVS